MSSKKKQHVKPKDSFDAERLLGGSEGVLTGKDATRYHVAVGDIPECTKTCPAGVNVKAYINLIANRKFEEAVEVIRKANPFPAVCGRVCTRPCEQHCELALNGDPIAIRALKKYASDYELARRPLDAHPCIIRYKEKIAVIGAGPAGLTAAVDLMNQGYPITVFEEKNEPGGMLRYGIPPYRLPDRILKREIDWIQNLGVTITTNKKISDPAELLKKGFSAVLIAGGAPKSFPLGIQGEKSKGVLNALFFLRELNSDRPIPLKGNVVVIGGGSTAIDAARSAIRLGAQKVVVAYRRRIEEMPAEQEEIEAAQKEGVTFKFLVMPKEIKTQNNSVCAITFYKAKLGEKDDSGRPRPLRTDATITLKADTIIPAVGAMPAINSIKGVNVTTSKGVVEVSEDGQTIIQGIFAAGDIELGSSTVVDAIGRGHNAARGIHAYLQHISLPKEEQHLFKHIQIYLGVPKCSRAADAFKRLAVGGKPTSFEEIETPLSDFQTIEEAQRCLTCGSCYACPTCLPNCTNKQLIATIADTTFLIKAPPELSKKITFEGAKTYQLNSNGHKKPMELQSLTAYVDPDLCIGCGRCEEVCAYRSIKNILTKDKRPIAEVAHTTCRSCSACVSECPAGAISQGYMSDTHILQRLQKKHSPHEGVKGLMSYWSTPSPVFNTYDGVVELMSARKASPMFLIRALAKAGRGLLLIRPDEITGSHYLPWEESPDEIIRLTKNLLASQGISPDRIHYNELLKGKKPSELIEELAITLDKKNLSMLNISGLQSHQSPLGETINLLRILGVNPDIQPYETTFSSPKATKQKKPVFFEACIPLLYHIGLAHKLFDLSPLRTAIRTILSKTTICEGFAQGLYCPSKNLENNIAFNGKQITKKIETNNTAVFKKIQPSKLIVPTPEAYVSFSQTKTTVPVSGLPDEIFEFLTKYKKLPSIHKTVALHHACTMNNDPFYESIKKLLSYIPNLHVIELNDACGQTHFEAINGESKEKALQLMHNAQAKKADMILCTSPYCQAHLLLCEREGCWNTVDIEITDIYQFLHPVFEEITK